MRIFGKVGETVPEPETAATEPTDDDADTIRTRAEQARAEAAQQRADAEALLTAAQAEADRILREAQQQAQQLTNDARSIDRHAEKLEDRLSYLVHVDRLDEQAAEAERTVVALVEEADGLREQLDAIAAKMEQLGAQREDATAALASARDRADVAGVTAQRSQLSAIDEVVGVLDGQRQQALQRIQAIGEPEGIGELAQVLQRALAARAEQRKTLNRLYPDRPEALHDALIEDLQATLDVQLAEMTEGQQQTRSTVVDVTRPTPSQEPPMTVRKNNIRKAKADAADQVACYDVNGNLVGICPQDAITPIADAAEAEPVTKRMLAEAGPGQQAQVAEALNTAAVRKFQQIRGTGR